MSTLNAKHLWVPWLTLLWLKIDQAWEENSFQLLHWHINILGKLTEHRTHKLWHMPKQALLFQTMHISNRCHVTVSCGCNSEHQSLKRHVVPSIHLTFDQCQDNTFVPCLVAARLKPVQYAAQLGRNPALRIGRLSIWAYSRSVGVTKCSGVMLSHLSLVDRLHHLRAHEQRLSCQDFLVFLVLLTCCHIASILWYIDDNINVASREFAISVWQHSEIKWNRLHTTCMKN